MEGVVLLHGILRTRWSMAGLARFLQAAGYKVLNLDYPGRRFRIEQLVERLHPSITTFAAAYEKVHFIGHSMGGLIIRAYLHAHRPGNLGRVVMLGPPNHGSEVADFFKQWAFYRHVFGPAGQQLTTNFSAAFLPETVNYETGIIAGTRTIDPISSFILGTASDGKVSVESTKITGMTDHIVIPVSHWHMPQSRRIWRLIHGFLKHGKFTPPSPR